MAARPGDVHASDVSGGDATAAVVAIASAGDVHTGEVPEIQYSGAMNEGQTNSHTGTNSMSTSVNSNPDGNQNPSHESVGISDPFATLSTMWTGWLSSGTSLALNASQPTATENVSNDPATGDSNDAEQAPSATAAAAAAAASAAATDLFEGAGRMWSGMSATLKDAAESMDSGALGSGVTVIRQKSGRLMEDVSRSVQSLNISTDFTKSASALTNSTMTFIDKASASLEQGRKEALEIFVDGNNTIDGPSGGTKTGAPWDPASLPDGEKPYGDTLRQEMLKLVVDSIYSRKKRTTLFLSNVADKANFSFDFNANAGSAMAALDADKNVRRLRAGLVPGKMKENEFWKTYFYHIHRIRQTLVANNGVMPDTTEEDVDDDELLFGDVGEADELAALDSTANLTPSLNPVESNDLGPNRDDRQTVAVPEGGRNWEEDIEAAFKDDDDDD